MRLTLLFSLMLLGVGIQAQTLEEQFYERLNPIYLAETPDDAVTLAKELYQWVEKEAELQTYVNYYLLHQIFTTQALDEPMAQRTKEQYEAKLQELTQVATQAASSGSDYDAVWYNELYPNLFNNDDPKAPYRAEKHLRQHPALQNYSNYYWLAVGMERKGDFDQAYFYYQKATSLEEDALQTFHSKTYFIWFLLKTGRYQRARALISRLEELYQTAGPYAAPGYQSEWLMSRMLYYLFTGDFFRYQQAATEQYAYFSSLVAPDANPCNVYPSLTAQVEAIAYEQLGDFDRADAAWRAYDSLNALWVNCTQANPTIQDQPYLSYHPLFAAKRGGQRVNPAANAQHIEALREYMQYYERYNIVANEYQNVAYLGFLGAQDYPELYQAVLKTLETNRDFTFATQPWSTYAYLRMRDGDFQEAGRTYRLLFEKNIDWINDILFSFGEQAFVTYFNELLKEGYDNYHAFVWLSQQRSDAGYARAVGQAYNNLLLTKSIGFKGSQRRKEAFLGSQDPAIQALYAEWLGKKQALMGAFQSKQRALGDTSLIITEDSLRILQDRVSQLEDRLATEANGFADQLQIKSVRWQQVQKRLQPGEAALEWVRFPWRNQTYYSDSAFYAAYIIRPEAKHPEVVYLPRLATELETDYYGVYANSIRYQLTDPLSYQAFWEPLEQALEGVSKVYIANDGIMHLINLATLYHPATEKYLGEELHIQYVTSTGTLAEDKPARLLRRAMLFGRPAYSVDEGEALPEADSSQERFFVANFQSLDIADLPGTEDEVSAIEQSLKEKGIAVDLYLGAAASEEALQAADHPGILHIATHGYWNTLDYEATQGYRAFNAMVNSGLLLSGVVNYYQSQERRNTYDGVLTAYEAQNLDLEGTDLVVLSACETGLGLFDAGEGVYGLQRAFRAAGAQSTLTSLWKVDDRATQQFMTAFYGYYLNGASKSEAYRKAQQDLRQQYSSPYYWGAFILNGE